eukprot:6005508-Prymnesium_polylepis.1
MGCCWRASGNFVRPQMEFQAAYSSDPSRDQPHATVGTERTRAGRFLLSHVYEGTRRHPHRARLVRLRSSHQKVCFPSECARVCRV